MNPLSSTKRVSISRKKGRLVEEECLQLIDKSGKCATIFTPKRRPYSRKSRQLPKFEH
jgi:hypothetical protein